MAAGIMVSQREMERIADGIEKKDKALKRVRAENKARPIITFIETLVGGAGIGALRGKFEKPDGSFSIPGTQIDIEGVAALLVSGGSLFVKSKWSQDGLAVGGGMMAHYLGQLSRKAVKGNFTMVAGGMSASELISGNGSVSSALASSGV